MTDLFALDLLSEAVLVLTTDGRIQFANQRALGFYGWSESPAGKRLSSLLEVAESSSDLDDLTEITTTPRRTHCVHIAADRAPERVEWTLHRTELSGVPHVVSVSRPLTDSGDGRTSELATGVDTDASTKHEGDNRAGEHHQQSQRMEAIGRLAGGVAHDFNNLLTGILGFVELSLLERPDAEGELVANLQEIRQAALQASDLTRRLLIFSRTQMIEPRVLDLCDLVVQAEKFLARVLSEDIQLVVEHQSEPALINIDPSQINHVLVNLASNAHDAMPQGGQLRIEVSALPVGSDFCQLHPEMTPGRYVQLSVTDTGAGLSKEQCDRAFEPFSSGNLGQRRTGLGLSTVYGIARQNGGVATVYSEVGVGTTLKLFLPEAQPPTQVSPTVTPPNLLATGESATVLLVEDEAIVRRVARQILERAGFTVFEAPDATTAILLHEQIVPVSLLVSDVVMPDMNGRELFENLSARQPGLRCVLMSGYTDDDMLQRGVQTSELNFVSKPFTTQSLLDKITRVVGGG